VKSFAVVLCALFFQFTSAHAQVQVSEPWIRATVATQKSSGAYMQLNAAEDSRLVSVSSPVAGISEIHEMAMSNDVMKMAAIKGLDLPAGKAVELKPGGYHVMLLNLKRQLKEGETVPLTLVVEGPDKKRQSIQVKAVVRPIQATSAEDAPAMHDMKH
jgi:hypothetical protein